MKKVKEFAGGIVFCLFELIAGMLLLIDPAGMTFWIIMSAGIVLMVLGVLEIVKYFRTSAKEASLGQTLTKGLMLLLAGGFCAFKAEWFLGTLPVLTIIYGIVILLTGIGKIQLAVDMLRLKNKKWFWPAINAVISVICAFVILCSPFASTVVLWSFTGISLIVEGILDLFTVFIGKDPAGE